MCHLVLTSDDIADKIYKVETKVLNQTIKRNINRFSESYCFKLTDDEYNSLRCQIGTLKNKRGEHRKYSPYVFTEYGINMPAGILKSDVAVAASLRIVNTFISMKKYI